MLTDLRHAFRSLSRAPGFAVVATVTLALGIGATSAMFTVTNRLVLQPLPFPASERLVLLWGSKPQDGLAELPSSQPDFEDMRAQARSFESLAAWALGRGNVKDGAEPEQVQFAIVTSSLFDVLRVRPALGRGFTAAEDRPGSAAVAVISHGLWERRFGGSTDVVGKTLSLDDRSLQVVGVMPPDFSFLTFPAATEVWVPLGLDPFEARRFARGARSMSMLGRLKEGVTLAQARSEADTIAARLAAAYPRSNGGRGFALVPLHEQVVKGIRTAALVLLAAVSLVLLIACANVASLLLARATSRHSELSIRAALGASRWRLIRHQLAESAVLGAAGGTAGLLLAVWLVDLLVAIPYRTDSLLVPYSVPRGAIGLDGASLIFTVIVTMATAVIFGLVPAWSASRPRIGETLRAEGRASGGRGQRHLRATLVVVEVALAFVLLVTAGLTIRSFVRLKQVNPGFISAGVLSADLTLSRAEYSDPLKISGFYTAALERIRSLPGVTGAAAVEYLPMSGVDGSTGFYIDGRPVPARLDEQQTHYRSVAGDYFSLMGIGLAAGRPLADRDDHRGARVAVINEAMARRYWPGESPLGKRLALEFESLRFNRDRAPDLDIQAGLREIVGVVRDVRHGSLQEQPVPEIYVPYRQRPVTNMSLVVRSSGDPLSLARPVRESIRALDPDQPIARVEVLSDRVSATTVQPRANVLLLSVFAAAALSLAMIGVYGLLSYSVVQRAQELGIRAALGGQRRDIQGLIMRDGLRLVALGLAGGVLGALALGRTVRTLLFGVATTDAVSFVAAAAMLVAVALAACYVPARRAAQVDPIVALRGN